MTGFDAAVEQVNITADGTAVVNVKYNRKSYTVTFYTNGGDEIPAQQVLFGAKVTLPENPVKYGTFNKYTLLNWYTDIKLNNVFDVNESVEESINLYAKWEQNTACGLVELPAGTDGTAGITGEYVLFGKYYINNATEMESIKWRVISKSEDSAVLLAENILMTHYYTDFSGNPYSSSTLRDFLNTDFYLTIFPSDERHIVLSKTIDTDIYNYETEETSYVYTTDHVYLLKQSELLDTKLFPDAKSRVRTPTSFVISSGIDTENPMWWLRSCITSDGNKSTEAIIIDKNGQCQNLLVLRSDVGIVPAITVHISNYN